MYLNSENLGRKMKINILVGDYQKRLEDLKVRKESIMLECQNDPNKPQQKAINKIQKRIERIQKELHEKVLVNAEKSPYL